LARRNHSSADSKSLLPIAGDVHRNNVTEHVVHDISKALSPHSRRKARNLPKSTTCMPDVLRTQPQRLITD
jgi:hypothetical protein